MELREHTSREFEHELTEVRERLLAMGRQVDEVVENAGRALLNRDVKLANRIILGDDDTDSMELGIDHLCLEILARRQPVAGDLRLLTSALKIVVDLERVGDLAVSIATRVVELEGAPPLLPYDELLEMLTLGRGMVSQALAALVDQDAALARRVIDKDGIVDSAAMRVFEEVLRAMRADPGHVFSATRIQAISKYIERIADHATNIAEQVIFVLTADDVRHRRRARPGNVS